MRILVTNDDGIRAPGLRALVDAIKPFGEIKVVAPDRERSCCAHALTMRDPLRVTEFEWDGCEAFEVNGFPADCVNVALSIGFPSGCDLVLSGINNGPNLGFDVTYSGTVGGAMEGTVNGIRSIAISVANLAAGETLRYDVAARWLAEHFEALVEAPQAPLTFLNVNVPNLPTVELRGHRVVGMGQRVYKDRVERREDPWGRTYYWQGGVAVLTDHDPATDVAAVSAGFVSVTPISLDWTNHGHIETISQSLKTA